MPFHETMDLRDAAARCASFRAMQLNTLAHWAVDGETDEQFDQRTALHDAHIRALEPAVVVLEEVDGPLTAPPGVLTLPQRLMLNGGYLGASVAKNNEKGDETWVLYRQDAASTAGPLGDAVWTTRFDNDTSSQCAIALTLRMTSIDANVIVVGYHAKAGRTAEHEATRIRHSTELWTKLTHRFGDDEAFTSGRVLLCGDFNAGPHDYGGQYPADWYPAVTSGLWGANGYVSAVRSHNGAEREAHAITTYKWRKGALIQQCIDYMFYNPAALTICGALRLPVVRRPIETGVTPEAPESTGDLPEGGLPHVGVWGSDHLSLCFDLTTVSPPIHV